ncbi:MAG: hypothetical protein EOP84_18275 [Verrucomicrobiaceae bacterium]|nr:MAG: hypothetical protein EOP84_18275 [Verrucomicrobiaceae bacterium]
MSGKNSNVTDFAVCAAVLIGVFILIAGGVHAIHNRQTSPQAQAATLTYELVANCKSAFMRRSREQIVRRSDGKLFYKDASGNLTGIAEDADIDQVCKTVDKRL